MVLGFLPVSHSKLFNIEITKSKKLVNPSSDAFFEFLTWYPGSAPMSRGTQPAQIDPDSHRGPPLKSRVLAKGHAAFPRLKLETLG